MADQNNLTPEDYDILNAKDAKRRLELLEQQAKPVEEQVQELEKQLDDEKHSYNELYNKYDRILIELQKEKSLIKEYASKDKFLKKYNTNLDMFAQFNYSAIKSLLEEFVKRGEFIDMVVRHLDPDKDISRW